MGCDCERNEAIKTDTVPAFVLDAIESDSERIPPPTRRWFERRLGVSLAQVRIAHGAQAQASADRLNVAAYAVGSRIVLGERALRGDSRETDWMLAHEIVHVLQQSTLATNRARWAPRNALEQQADTFAEALLGRHDNPQLGALLPARPRSLLMNPLWLKCSSICAGAGGGLEGVFMDFNIFTKAQGLCQINDCGTPVTPGLQVRGWCVYSCVGGGKKYAVFFINTRCGFVGPHYVF
jgi:hypothetical protein